MEPTGGDGQGSNRVLASAECEGQRLQMVRQEDDGLAIIMDDQPLYRWPAARVESCVKVYLSLLKASERE